MKQIFKILILTLIFTFNISTNPVIEYLDSSFGTNANGILSQKIGDSSKISAMVIDNNGKIVVTGTTTKNNIQKAFVARYNQNGTLDNSFGTDGISKLGVAPTASNTILIDFNNNILIGGYYVINNVNNYLIARFTPNGQLDLNFAKGGMAIKLVGSYPAIINSITLDIYGNILFAGTTVVNDKNNLFVGRYNTNGILDTTFGAGGIKTVTANVGYTGNAVKIDQNSKIIVAGAHAKSANTNFLLMRFNIDGSIDTTFGTNGIASTKVLNNVLSSINSMYIDSNNKIVVGGYSGNENQSDFTIARYNNDGTLDSSFGTSVNGIQITKIGSNSKANKVIANSEDQIYAVGFSDTKNVIIKYLINGSLDLSFGVNGILTKTIKDSNNLAATIYNDQIISGGTYKKTETTIEQSFLVKYNKNNIDYINISSTINENINTKIPAISGISSQANAQVKVLINDQLFKTTQTDNAGSWSVGNTNILPVGKNKIEANLIKDNINIVSQAKYFNVIDNFAEDSLFAFNSSAQTSTSAEYTTIPFGNNVKLGTWSYENSLFTCNKTGSYLIEYVANAGLTQIPLNTNFVNVSTLIAINDIEYLGSEAHASIDLNNNNLTRTLTRSFIKEINAGETISFKFAVNINGNSQGFQAGLMLDANIIGIQPVYSLTMTRIN